MARTCEASSSSTEVPRAPRRSSAEPHAPRFLLDRRVRRLGIHGEVLLGGEPYRLRRLSPAGVTALDALLDASSSAAAGRGSLAARLVADGVLHPLPEPCSPTSSQLDVVVPVRDDSTGLERLLAALPPELAARLIVVDDGSSEAHRARIAASAGAAAAVLVRRHEPAGPAAARNAARPACNGEVVAFLDADVMPDEEWLEPLLAHLSDGAVAAVAPRVRSSGSGPIARYEAGGSPLDLGEEPGLVGAHRRLSYVPTAALVCRRQALDEVGWFDATLRTGEDVDLLRRLEEHGWSVRYEPRSVVWHGSRVSLGSFLRQRFAYGDSAASLELRHPGSVAPFEGTLYTLGPVLALAGAVLGRRPVLMAVWLAATAVPTRSLAAKLRRVGADTATTEALAALLRAQAGAASGLATAIRRVWWPALLPLLAARRLRRPVVSILAASQLSGSPARWRAAGPPALALGLVDDAAYAAGVVSGCLRHRSVRALLPRLVSAAVSDEPSRPGERRGSRAGSSRAPSSAATAR